MLHAPRMMLARRSTVMVVGVILLVACLLPLSTPGHAEPGDAGDGTGTTGASERTVLEKAGRAKGKKGTRGRKGRKASAPLGKRAMLGAYVDGMTHDPARLADFERMVGHRAGVASYYWGYGDVFPGPTELAFADGGRREVLLSWDMGPTQFAEWTAGQHDDYLDTLVAAAASYPYDVHVRPWPEMNGDWQSFQPTAPGVSAREHGGTYREFKHAWRYVVTYFRSRGADNVKWVFNPTTDVYAQTTHVRRIWPGRAYVDVLGLDGFNWGSDRSWGRWQSFAKIFGPQYARLTRLHPTAPVWVCEVGSKEPRVDDGAPRDRRRSKAKWVRQALRTKRFERVEALVWFHEDKERDWRVNSSRGSLRALRAGL